MMRVDVDQLLIEGFIERLNGYSTRQVGAAFKQIVIKDKWFPRLAYLLEVLNDLFPEREPLRLKAPPPSVEDIAGRMVMMSFLKAVPALKKEHGDNLDHESFFLRHKEEHWDAHIIAAQEEFNVREAKQ